MADIELVIKIPEEIYKHILSMQFYIPGLRSGKSLLEKILKAIRTGTPLPKGHGDLMRRIIADSPNMLELYNLYTKPLNVTHTTMPFQEYRTKRLLPPDRPNDAELITLRKRDMEMDLFECIKENIDYKIDTECMTPSIHASIFVGRK